MTDPQQEDLPIEVPQTRRDRIRTIIFEADTPAGKAFDVALIITILVSVLAVMLDTVDWVHQRYGHILYVVEWAFTIAFTLEYAVRLWCINQKWGYARSFYGIIDLLGILPTYISLFVADAQYMLVIRILRVLRVFRVLRMVRYVGEAEMLKQALVASRRKITVFITSVLALVVIFGSLMYLVEGDANCAASEENCFSSIPKSIYWAVITLTTVGYGDLTPQTPIGQALAAIIMVFGYGIIAIPTGIVTLELSEASRRRANTRVCSECSAEGHRPEAVHCWRCGSHLFRQQDETEPGKSEQG